MRGPSREVIPWESFYRGNPLLVGFKCSREHSNYMGGVISCRRGFRFPGHLLFLQGAVKFFWRAQFSFYKATFLDGVLYFLVISFM